MAILKHSLVTKCVFFCMCFLIVSKLGCVGWEQEIHGELYLIENMATTTTKIVHWIPIFLVWVFCGFFFVIRRVNYESHFVLASLTPFWEMGNYNRNVWANSPATTSSPIPWLCWPTFARWRKASKFAHHLHKSVKVSINPWGAKIFVSWVLLISGKAFFIVNGHTRRLLILCWSTDCGVVDRSRIALSFGTTLRRCRDGRKSRFHSISSYLKPNIMFMQSRCFL